MSIFFSSLLFCVVFILLLRNLSFRFDLVDHPTAYKHHILSTPTVGGPSMFLAAFLTLLFWNQPYTEKNFLLINCAGLMAILGMLDDKQSMRIGLRMIIQVFVALIVVYFADGLITHLGRLLGGKEIQLGILAVPCSVIALVGSINAINMIDGIDGLAGKMVLISILGVSVIFYLTGVVENLTLTWAISGALVGFLLINLLRAPCAYPRGKTAGYYGAENQKRRATLTSKTQTIMLPVARPRGIASLIHVFSFSMPGYLWVILGACG